MLWRYSLKKKILYFSIYVDTIVGLLCTVIYKLIMCKVAVNVISKILKIKKWIKIVKRKSKKIYYLFKKASVHQYTHWHLKTFMQCNLCILIANVNLENLPTWINIECSMKTTDDNIWCNIIIL